MNEDIHRELSVTLNKPETVSILERNGYRRTRFYHFCSTVFPVTKKCELKLAATAVATAFSAGSCAERTLLVYILQYHLYYVYSFLIPSKETLLENRGKLEMAREDDGGVGGSSV
jgi:hypothetical protein